MQTQINIYDRKRKTYAESYVTEEQHENIKKKKRIHEKEKSASIFGSPKDDKIKQRKMKHQSKFRKNSSTIGLQSLNIRSDKVLALYVLSAIDVAYTGDLSLAFVQIITMLLVSLSHLLNCLMISNTFVKSATQK